MDRLFTPSDTTGEAFTALVRLLSRRQKPRLLPPETQPLSARAPAATFAS
jgi:hypothetical protein